MAGWLLLSITLTAPFLLGMDNGRNRAHIHSKIVVALFRSEGSRKAASIKVNSPLDDNLLFCSLNNNGHGGDVGVATCSDCVTSCISNEALCDAAEIPTATCNSASESSDKERVGGIGQYAAATTKVQAI